MMEVARQSYVQPGMGPTAKGNRGRGQKGDPGPYADMCVHVW